MSPASCGYHPKKDTTKFHLGISKSSLAEIHVWEGWQQLAWVTALGELSQHEQWGGGAEI